MSSIITLTKNIAELEQRYQARFLLPELFEPVYYNNAFGHGAWPVITGEFPHIIQFYRWGLIPNWVKGIDEAEKIRTFNINARCETIYDKRSFAASIKYSRCLIPCTGFFYWKHEDSKRTPYYIHRKDGDIFSIAGIWSSWLHKETENLYHTFCLLTTPANTFVASINNTSKRMPLILPQNQEAAWLDYYTSKEQLQELFLPYAGNELTAHAVGDLINSKTENRNTPEVIKPI